MMAAFGYVVVRLAPVTLGGDDASPERFDGIESHARQLSEVHNLHVLVRKWKNNEHHWHRNLGSFTLDELPFCKTNDLARLEAMIN